MPIRTGIKKIFILSHMVIDHETITATAAILNKDQRVFF